MQIRILLSILFFFGLSVSSAIAQGKLIMLNGKEKRFSTAEVKGEIIVYQPEDTTRNVNRKVDKYDVFAIVRADGSEEIIYNPDTVTGEDPTVAEVRDYIKGERFASQVYRKPLNLISGIAVGGAGSIIGFYGLIVPVVYPAVLGRFTPDIKEPIAYNFNETTRKFDPISEGTSTNINVSEAFSAGYGKKARNLKIKNSLIGGGIGFAVGITALILVLGND